jgi:hypothetical protein
VRSSHALAAAALAPLLLASTVGSVSAGCITARRVFEVSEAGKVPFRQPSDLVLAGERLFVLDDLNGRVAVLDLEGRAVGSVPLPGAPETSYRGLGFGGADQLFLASSAEGKIVVLDLKGKVAREFSAGEPDHPATPAGVLVSRGSVFVSDAAGRRMRVFSLEGKAEAAWGSLGDGPAQFRSPLRIARDSIDRILVTDALNSRVLAFTPKGEPLQGFGEFGTVEGTLFRPSALAVLEGDQVIVADNYFGSLQLFDAKGAYQGVLCGPGGTPLALANPLGLAVRGRTVFALETGGGRVSAYEFGSR